MCFVIYRQCSSGAARPLLSWPIWARALEAPCDAAASISRALLPNLWPVASWGPRAQQDSKRQHQPLTDSQPKRLNPKRPEHPSDWSRPPAQAYQNGTCMWFIYTHLMRNIYILYIYNEECVKGKVCEGVKSFVRMFGDVPDGHRLCH